MVIDRSEWLARVFPELADTLIDDFDVVEFLSMVVERTAELLDASEVGLVLIDQHGALRVMASSTERMHDIELFELQTDEGPCQDAVRDGRADPEHQSRRIVRPVASVQPARPGGRLSHRARAPDAPSLPTDRRGEHLRHPAQGHRPDRRDRGPRLRGRRDHRDPPGARVATGSRPDRAAAARPQQPDHDRAGQGCGRRPTRHRHRGGLRVAAYLRPKPEPSPRRRRRRHHHLPAPGRGAPGPVRLRRRPLRSRCVALTLPCADRADRGYSRIASQSRIGAPQTLVSRDPATQPSRCGGLAPWILPSTEVRRLPNRERDGGAVMSDSSARSDALDAAVAHIFGAGLDLAAT